MMIALHKQARTTPAVRAEIAASLEPVSVLARRHNITEATVRKWRARSEFQDRPHTAHHLQTQLTPAQEVIAVYLRRSLLLSLDDLLVVTREFLCPSVSRSGLDRCLRRHGVGNLRKLMPEAGKAAHKPFKAYLPGYLHMDIKYLPQMADETTRRYLFVAIDRATRWVFIAIKPNKTAASAKAFLKALSKACPIKITKLLTDNGKEFTDRLFGSRDRRATGNHEFDQLCQALEIEHRLTQPRTPQTNGMVERFNGRIADILRTHRFVSGQDLEETLHRYVSLYNQQLPQTALGSKPPIQAMKDWFKSHPELFHRKPYDRPGCDSYVTTAHAVSSALPTTGFRCCADSCAVSVPTLSCWGFESPMNQLVTVKHKNRVLPLKMQLTDAAGTLITSAGVQTPPVVEIVFSGGVPAAVPDDTYLAAGQGDIGNTFTFVDNIWQFNLQTKNFSGAGTYTIRAISGNPNEYLINPRCQATFVISH
jgi:transposase InsO family protein